MLEVPALLEGLQQLDHLVDAVLLALEVALLLLEGGLLVELAEVLVRLVEKLLGHLVLQFEEPAGLLKTKCLQAGDRRHAKPDASLLLAHGLGLA